MKKVIFKMNLSHTLIQDNRGKEQIGGVIFNTQIDLSHPLAFGYENNCTCL